MDTILASLSPYIIGSAIVPAQIIIVILLLKSPRKPALKATAFLVGLTLLRLLQGLVFGLILTDSAAATAEEGGGKSPIVMTLLLVLGLFLLISAIRSWQKEEDADAPPPKWLTMIDSLTPLKALQMGFGLALIGPKLWVFTLSAISVIGERRLGQPSSTVAFLLFVLLAQALLLLLILIRALLPGQSKNFLSQLSDWLVRNNQTILIVVSLVFGFFFVYKGASGLLSLGG